MRVTLTVDNSMSRIEGLGLDATSALRSELSYKLDFAASQYIPNPMNRVKHCIDKKGYFPSGLLPRVEDFCVRNGIKPLIVDNRSTDPVFKLPNRSFKKTLGIKAYPAQVEALNAVMAHKRGILSLPTGSGKSHIIAMILEALKMRTLVIVPTLELKAQLRESLSASLTSMDSITIENIDSNVLSTARDYDCLIIDESHHVAAKTYHKLNKDAWGGTRYRYFLTATPFRNNSQETLLFEGVAGAVIYELTYAKAVEAGMIVPVDSYYYEIPRVKTEAFTYAQVYKELVVDNEFRNNLIAELLINLNNNGRFTLCLVKEIRHGEILSNLTGIPFVNGADEDSRAYIGDFNKGRITSLIGTTGVLSEGVDTKPAEYVILAALGKAKSNLMQSVGRTLRTYPDKESGKIIIFKDKSHKFTLRHFKMQCKVLEEEYNITPIKLEIEE